MALEDYGTGRCINCGFLGERLKASGSHNIECFGVTKQQRLHGQITIEGYYEVVPCCFVGKYNLPEELGDISWMVPKYHEKVSEIIGRDRHCEDWYTWREFLSPKDHYEEFKMRQLEQDRREWQKWMAEQAERERKQSDKMLLRWTILGIVLGVLLAIMQLIGAFWAQALFRN